MTVLGAEIDVSRSNFFSLMFFVMAIGLLFVYMTLGWASNVIAQVCHDYAMPRKHRLKCDKTGIWTRNTEADV